VQCQTSYTASFANGHSLMVWFKPNYLASNINILFSHGLHYISFHFSGNRPFHSARINGVQISINGNTVVSIGNWYLITGTFDNTNLKVYLNDKLDGILNNPGSDTIDSSCRIGLHRWGSYASNGLIDEVRIYNRALSDQEIKALYEATK